MKTDENRGFRILWRHKLHTTNIAHFCEECYRFENAGFLFTCGRTKTEVFEYSDVMNYILLTLRMLCEWCFRFHIAWAGENDSNTLRVDAYFFRNGGQNSPFSKIPRCVWTRPKPSWLFKLPITPCFSFSFQLVFQWMHKHKNWWHESERFDDIL